MSDPKVIIWPAGDHNDGTSQYRLYLPGLPLERAGYDVSVDMTGPVLLWSEPWDASNGNRPPPHVQIMGLDVVPDADVIVMQRPAERWWSDVIPLLQAEGIRVVVDVDDRFDAVDEGNVAKRAFDPNTERGKIHSYEWVNRACKTADLVTCTTPALRDRYGFGHGLVLPNYVPESYLDIDGIRPATIGWSGAVATHPKDLQMTAGAVPMVLRESGWGFHAVGSGQHVQEALGLDQEPTKTGWVAFAQYPHELAKMTIGIVPLADTAFNRCKSALKMSEMAAVGVPVVGSPTPDNLRLNALGVGLIAKNGQQWKKKLKSLINNADYRDEVAGRGRAIMATQTYEKHAQKWWDAWTATKPTSRSRRNTAISKLDRLLETEPVAG